MLQDGQWKRMMTDSKTWDRISAYVTENKIRVDLEAKAQQKNGCQSQNS